MPSITPRFGIRELAEEARKVGGLDLAQGIIDAPPPAVLLHALRDAPLEEQSTYTNKRGVPLFRQAVTGYLQHQGWNLSQENVLATSGITAATTTALLAELKPGATVTLPEPFFIGHRLLLENLGFTATYLPVPLTGEPAWPEIEKAFEKADALIVTTPANPTGYCVPPDVLAQLTEKAAAAQCLLLLDETYHNFVWEHDTPDESAYDTLNLAMTVIMRSFSKVFSVPGWRVGYSVTDQDRVEKMATTHDALYLGGSTIAQYALADALAHSKKELADYIQQLRQQLLHNRDVMEEVFRALGMEPHRSPGTYYMLIKHNRSSDMAAFQELFDKKIVVTPANILFSDPTQDTGYIRIHFGVSAKTAQKVRDILRT